MMTPASRLEKKSASNFQPGGPACVAAQVVGAGPPDRAAAVFGETHTDYYDAASWLFGGVIKLSSTWCAAVGSRIDCDLYERVVGALKKEASRGRSRSTARPAHTNSGASCGS